MARAARRLFTFAIVLLVPLSCVAQTGWKPDRTVEIVVGSAAGGGNDRTARTIQRVWQETRWLEKAVVVNKVGGSGALAYTYTAQHSGDAHTIAVARTGLLTNHILGHSKLGLSDITPLAMVADDAMSLTVRVDSPIRSLKDLIARWKADPQSVSISLGSSRGSTTHFLVALLAKGGGVDPRALKVLTFGGGADSVTNLLGGHINMVSLGLGNVAEHHKAGRMRVLGVASEKRSAALPDVPTLKEQGYPVVQGGWTAMIGAKDLSPAQVAYWESLLERTVNHDSWKRSLEQDYAEWVFMKSSPTAEFLKKDYDTARALLSELGMAK